MFGFAVQPRLGSIGSRFAQPTQSTQQQQAPAINFDGMASGNMSDIRSGLSKLGIGSPPAGAAPAASGAPVMPALPGMDAAAAAAPAADAAGAGGVAAAGADAGASFLSQLAALFL